MKFISRKDLGWPPSAAPVQRGNPLGVKIHYEGTRSPVRDHSHCKDYWTQVRNSHLANKAEGYSDVAYNLAVCRHGYVLEGRGSGHQTGANGNQALNKAHYSICVLYGTNDDAVTGAVISAVREAIQYLRDHGAGKEIKGHRDGYATACPGDPLYALVKSGTFEPNKEDDLDPIDVWAYKNQKELAKAKKAGKHYPDMHERLLKVESNVSEILRILKSKS